MAAETFFAIGPRFLSDGQEVTPPSGLQVPRPQTLQHGNPSVISRSIGKYTLYATYESMTWGYTVTDHRTYHVLLGLYFPPDPRVWVHIYDPQLDAGGWFSASMGRPVLHRAPGMRVAGNISVQFLACERYIV